MAANFPSIISRVRNEPNNKIKTALDGTRDVAAVHCSFVALLLSYLTTFPWTEQFKASVNEFK